MQQLRTLPSRPPEIGQLVDVRSRRYVVLDIKESLLTQNDLTTGALQPHAQHLLTLSSVEDDALGETLQVVWEVEAGATTIEDVPLPEPTGFDDPLQLDTFLNAVRWGAASSADVRAIQAPFRSGIDLEDYQLDPVSRAITMPRVNLLVADDVGLGKTIEAGLVAQELLIRHRARRIVIVCPASLQVQWRDQMQDKFGLEFRIIDSRSLHELRRDRGLHVNPWTHFPRLITSIDFLKRERPLRLFLEILPAEGASPYPRKFDLLILDEAHNIAPSGRGKYATDSQRTRTIRRLTPHFEHRLFLSATPHNGYRESFSALLELLDNQRFARGVDPDPRQLETIMIRRLKSELPRRWDGSARFPERKITPLHVTYSSDERAIHHTLHEYCQARITQASDDVERYATEFVARLLKKRLFSSPEAFLKTLEQHELSINDKKRHTGVTRRPAVGILRSQIEQLDEENDNDEALDDAARSALAVTAPLFRPPTSYEQELLQQMRTWADHASHHLDNKAQCLIDWLKQTIKPQGKWSQERVIIFTEYRDSQRWLSHQLTLEGLAEKGPDGEDRLLLLYGGMQTEKREEIKAAFQADPEASSVRILLATDAASEGIDLQNHCSHLIHYEIPWNPNRLEQRNGRIDRHGQRAANVNIYHFVSSAYSEEGVALRPTDQLDDDLEFLRKAVDKIETIREDLGNVGPVIATQVEEAMLGRRRELDTRQAEEQTPSRRLQAFARKKRKEVQEHISQLYRQLLDGKRELNLTPENIQAVVETALELAKQPPLQKRTLHDVYGKHSPIEVFDVPELSESWRKCTDGLAHPHTHEKRPVVFNHELVRGRDDVVLAHLNHRLVTMALRLLRAEIWEQDNRKMYRVTARTVPGYSLDTPVVIAYARLLILGGDNTRLHEELITAGGYPRAGKFETLKEKELKTLLSDIQDQPVSEQMQQQLANHWSEHRRELAHALEIQMARRAKSLQKDLGVRAEKEQRDIRTILGELQQSIRQELKRPDVVQLQLTGFSSEEREQAQRDLTALERRAQEINVEMQQEVERIQLRFAQPQPRLFPVAVMYLVPERLAR